MYSYRQQSCHLTEDIGNGLRRPAGHSIVRHNRCLCRIKCPLCERQRDKETATATTERQRQRDRGRGREGRGERQSEGRGERERERQSHVLFKPLCKRDGRIFKLDLVCKLQRPAELELDTLAGGQVDVNNMVAVDTCGMRRVIEGTSYQY